MQGAEREMTLREWCDKLPVFHAVNQQREVLEHCRDNPLRWWIWDRMRAISKRLAGRSPIERDMTSRASA